MNAPPPDNPATKTDHAAIRLGMVLQLARRARQADIKEMPFIFANETRQLLPYRQSAFFRVDNGKPHLLTLSGLSGLDTNAPYAVWIKRFAALRLQSVRQPGATVLSLPVMAGEDKAPTWLAGWNDMVPEHGLECPLFGPGGWVCGYLVLFRETQFTPGEARIFSHVAEAYGETFGAAQLRPKRRWRLNWWRIAGIILALAAVCAMAVPVPQTALAQAEVAPRRPALVRAGVDGVIDKFLVQPNQRVKQGEPILHLDDTQLKTRLAVARKAEEMARIELRQLQQAALSDPASKARVPLAHGRIDQLVAEAGYVESLLQRVTAVSPMAGIALVDNPDEWQGRPVNLGQKIMMVADPDDVMLEVFLPIGESMPLAVGDRLLFFANIAPASPVLANVSFISYRAVELPGKGMAFRIRADFEPGERPMLGLRGTARLEGKPVRLGLLVLRRPIRAVRQWLGW